MQRLVRALSEGQLIGVYTTLPRRALLHVHGPDTYRFLNGLVTQKIERFDKETPTQLQERGVEVIAEEKCIYAAFLTTRGRILTDALFYHRPLSRSWFIETDRRNLPIIIRHLQQYKLRAKISIEEDAVNAWHVAALLCASLTHRDDLLRFLLHTPLSSHDMQFYIDPRHPLFLRLLFSKGSISSLSLPPNVYVDPTEEGVTYQWLRTVAGVNEGPEDVLPDSVPFEVNLDMQGGIHFHKGCYVGQELVARTHHTGVVRRRLLPFLVLSSQHSLSSLRPLVVRSDTLIPRHLESYVLESNVLPSIVSANISTQEAATQSRAEDSSVTVTTSQGVKVGRIISHTHGVGWAALRLEHLPSHEHEDSNTNVTPLYVAGTPLQIIWPFWWPTCLNQLRSLPQHALLDL
jgi:folate-binding protein YgfZ